MNISNVSQTEYVQVSKNSQPKTLNQTTDVNDSSSSAKTIDMRNISLNEINALMKFGEDGILPIYPLIPPSIVDKYGPEYAANMKMDFLSQVENIIAFKKNAKEETKLEEMFLEKIKALNGMEIPSIDTVV